MNDNFTCPVDKKNKYYIIPTNKWLIPYKKLITNELNENGLLMIIKSVKNEKILVKITKGLNKDVITFNELFTNEPNFIKTYCNFSCWENKNNLKSEYKDIGGFCNINDKNNDHLITLEIMKRYNDGNLEKRTGNTLFKAYICILRQIILAQLYAFDKYGFIHLDLHLGNILIEQYDKPINITYLIKNNPYAINDTNIIIETKLKIIITDFDNCISYDPEIYKKYNPEFLDIKITYDYENTLFSKLVSTILNSTRLLNLENERVIFSKLNNYINTNENYRRVKISNNKTLKNYYLNRIKFDEFKSKHMSWSIKLANELFDIITEGNEFLAVGLRF